MSGEGLTRRDVCGPNQWTSRLVARDRCVGGTSLLATTIASRHIHNLDFRVLLQ